MQGGAEGDDDSDVEPEKRYSSSDVVVAAEQLKFETKQKKEQIERKAEAKGMSKEEVEKEMEKQVGTIGHQLERHELGDHYKTDLENGLTEAEAEAKNDYQHIHGILV